ncbi:BURP domain protein RD22-like [Vitis riparia]|uniref:BURP domain protein RD22-like n=1 Tax=Vitis riparia TaxID=96939 RepID=UPI00155B3E03|nr:BURP domain protein RD22-like [Vitis riparia]
MHGPIWHYLFEVGHFRYLMDELISEYSSFETLYISVCEASDPSQLWAWECEAKPTSSNPQKLPQTTNEAMFLPRQVADSIPFSSKKLPKILNRLSVKEKSAETELMKKEIEECEEAAMDGESRFCATSLESLIDFSTSKLGRNVNEVKTGSQEYGFGVGMKNVADKSVVCHKMNYPYAVFYCHTFTKTRTYMIPLVGADGLGRPHAVGAKLMYHCDKLP